MDKTLASTDYRHLWHPYTDHPSFEQSPHTCIEWAEEACLYDSTGRAILDGIASWWCVSLGHGHPHVVEAIKEQAETLQQCILGGISHLRAIELAERLATLAPGDLNRCYFAADGSSVVEAALKIAVQYWQLRGKPEKTRFLSLENAYHGDTLGAMGVGMMQWFQEPYGVLVHPAIQVPSPSCTCCDHKAWGEGHCAHSALRELERTLQRQSQEIAAIIVEPLCQAAAGMRFYPSDYLRELRRLCDQHEVLFIADEIATGFGRTGAMFACDHAGVVPDLMCLGKALTAGYLPMSALLARDAVFEAFQQGEYPRRVLWDGHTFCGNPITAAAAVATLEVYERLGLPQSAQARMEQLNSGFAALAAGNDAVEYHRSLGMIGMCALRESAGGAARAKRACARALELGLFVRPLGEVLYLWPPLTVGREDLERMLAILAESVQQSG